MLSQARKLFSWLVIRLSIYLGSKSIDDLSTELVRQSVSQSTQEADGGVHLVLHVQFVGWLVGWLACWLVGW